MSEYFIVFITSSRSQKSCILYNRHVLKLKPTYRKIIHENQNIFKNIKLFLIVLVIIKNISNIASILSDFNKNLLIVDAFWRSEIAKKSFSCFK